ncbi:MAG: hypothetical protein R6W82_04615 [bacterium]
MDELTYSLRDVWRAPRMGASGKKIGVGLRAVAAAYLVYLVMGWLSWLAAGLEPGVIWTNCRLFPLSPGPALGALPLFLFNAGLAGAVLTLMIGSAGAAKITYRELKGDDFYGGSDAWKYALEQGSSMIGVPVLLVGLSLLILLLLYLLALLLRIPGAGVLLGGLLALPAAALALMGVWFGLGGLLAILYAPAVAGTTGEDSLEGAIQVLGMMWAAPWRTAVYTAAALLATLLAGWLLGLVTLAGLLLGGTLWMGAAGPGFRQLAAGAEAWLPDGAPAAAARLLLPGPLHEGLPLFAPAATGGGMAVQTGGFLLMFALLVITALVAAYVLASLASGLTAAYLVLRWRKDGEELPGWSDEIDELEEGMEAGKVPDG